MSQSFAVYLIGFAITVIGLALGAHLAHVPTPWIVAGVLVLVGLGILKALTRTSTKIPRDR